MALNINLESTYSTLFCFYSSIPYIGSGCIEVWPNSPPLNFWGKKATNGHKCHRESQNQTKKRGHSKTVTNTNIQKPQNEQQLHEYTKYKQSRQFIQYNLKKHVTVLQSK